MKVQDIPGVKVLPDGKIKLRVTRKGAGTRKATLPPGTQAWEVLRVKAELQAELEAEVVPRQWASVNDYAVWWLDGERCTPRTLARKSAHLTHHILPHLGHLRPEKVTRGDLERLSSHLERATNTKSGGPLSASYLRVIWTTTQKLILDMYADIGSTANPFCRVNAPRTGTRVRPTRQKTALTREQRTRLAVELRKHPHCPYHLLALVQLSVGCRYTAAAALTWDRVGEDLHFTHGWTCDGLTDRPKTAAGRRVVPCPPMLRASLDAYRRHLIGTQCPTLAHGWVFGSPAKPSVPVGSESVNQRLALACEAAGVPVVKGHDLRRTWRTLARRAGVNARVSQALMGHTDDDTHDTYDLPSREDLQAALEAVGEG